MNDYTGKVCPYCKTEFGLGDDIVVCSECDMPHHKECWVENQSCTTFGCLGTIKAADCVVSSVTATQMNYDDSKSNAAPERKPQSMVYEQANLGSGNPYSCVNQQSNIYRTQHNEHSGGDNTYWSHQTANVDADILQLVGVKTEYYISQFQMMKSECKSASWNWPAFLVTPYWMAYRKMYGYAAAVLVVDIIISMIGSAFLSLLAFGGYIIFGIMGNSIYMRHLEGKAYQAKGMNEPYKSQFITTNSGVNTTAAILVIIGRVITVGILLG